MSPRRLVFTDTEVYFQCRQMFCREGAVDALSYGQSGGPLEPALADHTEANHPLPSSTIKHISEFSCRNFSFDCDFLDAFAGILQSYRERKNPIDDLWGLPLFSHAGLDGQNPSETFQLAQALLWYSPTWATRRKEFPSWTWAGWKVIPARTPSETIRLPMVFESFPWLNHSCTCHAMIAVQYPNQQPMQWEGRKSDITQLSRRTRIPPTLLITAFVFSCRYEWNYRKKGYTLVGVNSGNRFKLPLYRDNSWVPKGFEKKVKKAAIMFSHDLDNNSTEGLYKVHSHRLLLSCERRIDGHIYHERVGVAHCHSKGQGRGFNFEELVEVTGAKKQLFRLV